MVRNASEYTETERFYHGFVLGLIEGDDKSAEVAIGQIKNMLKGEGG